MPGQGIMTLIIPEVCYEWLSLKQTGVEVGIHV